MNKYKFSHLSFGNLSPFLTSKGGRGFLTIEEDHLSFGATLDTIRIPKTDTYIHIINEENFRVFNTMYKFFYVRTKSLSDIMEKMQEQGYPILERENATLKVGIWQRDFSRVAFIVIFASILLFFLIVILFKYNFF